MPALNCRTYIDCSCFAPKKPALICRVDLRLRCLKLQGRFEASVAENYKRPIHISDCASFLQMLTLHSCHPAHTCRAGSRPQWLRTTSDTSAHGTCWMCATGSRPSVSCNTARSFRTTGGLTSLHSSWVPVLLSGNHCEPFNVTRLWLCSFDAGVAYLVYS